jgi:hypothetical protein
VFEQHPVNFEQKSVYEFHRLPFGVLSCAYSLSSLANHDN